MHVMQRIVKLRWPTRVAATIASRPSAQRSEAGGIPKAPRAGCSFWMASILLSLACLLGTTCPGQSAGNFLRITNGYFWDSAIGDYFIPRGVAYQIWNPPVGA